MMLDAHAAWSRSKARDAEIQAWTWLAEAADLPLPLSQPAPTVLRGLRSAWYEAGAQLVHLTEARF